MGEGVVVRPDQVSLGVLVEAVPRDAVDEAVAVCGVREKRSDAKLPAHVITYLTLALTLFPEDDYEEVATKVTGSLDRWGCWNAGWTVLTAAAHSSRRCVPTRSRPSTAVRPRAVSWIGSAPRRSVDASRRRRP